MFYLYDMFPKTGEERFEISTTPNKPCHRFCSDKSKKALQESRKLLLNAWESNKVSGKVFTPSKGPFLCVTGHSEDLQTTYYQPWWQNKEETEKRGFEFTE